MFEGSIPSQHQENAERVRKYLVTVRGGAPFLSGADCRLLVQWLDDAVPIATILAVIDRVSDRRRVKRVRTRMSLTVCKGELKKLMHRATGSQGAMLRPTAETESPASVAAKRSQHRGIAHWISQLKSQPLSTFRYKEQQDFAQQLYALQQQHDVTEFDKLSNAVSALITNFHKNLWEATIDEHEQLSQQAELELASLKTLLPTFRWSEAVEEVMRESVRSRCPLINAQTMWNALNETNL